MPLELCHMHKVTYVAGQSGYYNPLPRGCFEVYEDNKRYIYDKSCQRVRHIRTRILAVFLGQKEGKLRGRYPSYTVDPDPRDRVPIPNLGRCNPDA